MQFPEPSRQRPSTALAFALGAAALLLPADDLASQPALRRGGEIPLAAADFRPAYVPDAAALSAAGWNPSTDEGAGWELVAPRIPVQRGVAMLVHSPERLPRPVLRRGERRISAPLAADQELLGRQESPTGALLTWKPRLRIEERPTGLVVLEVDVPPFQPAIPPDQHDLRSAFRHAERLLAEAPLAATSALRVSPDRRFRLEPPPELPSDEPKPSGVRLEPVRGGVSEDSTLVTADGGASWWRARLSVEAAAARTHSLTVRDVFALGEAIAVAPTPIAPDGARELVLFEGAAREPRAWSFPVPVSAPWRCDLADLSDGDGAPEALVMVHDPDLRRPPSRPAADSWAARLRWTAGEWREVERVPLPGDCRALELRFDGAGGMRLEHEGRLLARRALLVP